MPEKAPAAPAAADTPASGDAARSDTDALIDRWFSDNFHGSIVARDADTLNHVYASAQKLKALLRG
jgi:hypothetical protein